MLTKPHNTRFLAIAASAALVPCRATLVGDERWSDDVSALAGRYAS
jgi:hypothetical protein